MRIESQLRRLYPAAPPADAAARDALEAKLTPAFVSRAPPRRRWLLGVVVGGLALAGACVVPTDYDLDVGHRILVTLRGEHPGLHPEAVAHYIEDNYDLDELRVMVQHAAREGGPSEGSELRIALDLVGRVDIAAVEDALVAQFPALADADIDIEALDGTVHGTFGGMLSQRALGLTLDEGSIEETRARILAELAARGLDGDATIEIEEERTEDGVRREVKVRVEANTP